MRNIFPGWPIPRHPCHQSLCGFFPCRPVFILDSLSVSLFHNQQASHISTNCGVNTLYLSRCDVHITAHFRTIQLQQKASAKYCILKVKTSFFLFLFFLFLYQSPPVYLPSGERGCKTNQIISTHNPPILIVFLVVVRAELEQSITDPQ